MDNVAEDPTPKQLTLENVLVGDPWTLVWANVYDLKTGESREMTIEEFIEPVVQPKLSTAAPLTVRDLYEGARGAMAYGYYYYPLYMLGVERLFSTLEAAARHRAKQLRSDWPAGTTFHDHIEFLAAQGAISEAQRQAWHSLRNMRNSVVHTDRKQLAPPGPALTALFTVAEQINQLFSESPT